MNRAVFKNNKHYRFNEWPYQMPSHSDVAAEVDNITHNLINVAWHCNFHDDIILRGLRYHFSYF